MPLTASCFNPAGWLRGPSVKGPPPKRQVAIRNSHSYTLDPIICSSDPSMHCPVVYQLDACLGQGSLWYRPATSLYEVHMGDVASLVLVLLVG